MELFTELAATAAAIESDPSRRGLEGPIELAVELALRQSPAFAGALGLPIDLVWRRGRRSIEADVAGDGEEPVQLEVKVWSKTNQSKVTHLWQWDRIAAANPQAQLVALTHTGRSRALEAEWAALGVERRWRVITLAQVGTAARSVPKAPAQASLRLIDLVRL